MMEKVREAKRQLNKARQMHDWDYIVECNCDLLKAQAEARETLARDLAEFMEGYDHYDFVDSYDSMEDAVDSVMESLGNLIMAKEIMRTLCCIMDDTEIDEERETARNLWGRMIDYEGEMGLWKDVLMTSYGS